MTIAPGDGHDLFPEARGQAPGDLARWAVWLATAATVAIVGSVASFAVAFAVGGSSATEDNAVGVIVGVLLFAGLLASLVAFVLAVAAKVKHEQWALLAFPLSVFPTALALIVLGEAFWWE